MNIYKDFPLSKILWYKIGGKTRYFLQAEDPQDIEKALEFIAKNKIDKVFFCGMGSNLIFSDDYFNGAVIQIVTNRNSNNFPSPLRGDPACRQAGGTGEGEKDGLISVFSGTILDEVIKYSFGHNLTGLEWAGGLPGTVGAGIRGNVGAFGSEIKESFVQAQVIERKVAGFTFKTLKKEEVLFSYRNSVIKQKKNLIVVSAEFRLKPGNKQELEIAKETYSSNINYRKTHHPVEYPTCGSVFKNITEIENREKILTKWPDIKVTVEKRWHGKVSMGYVIDRLGLTGYRVGNMQVSDKHSNFIINLGGGKAAQVITIIKDIQSKVSETFGFTPEVEVEIVE